jgi:cytochrome P450
MPHAFIGWGGGRHNCLGMRFAKLELHIIAAYLLSMYDIELCDVAGNNLEKLPSHWENHNNWNTTKPHKPVRLRYELRKEVW